jgi:hypothetical protein
MTKEYSWFKIDCPICGNGLRELPKQEQDEPVAWGMKGEDGSILDVICPDEHAREEGSYTIPLYTHPKLKDKNT